MPRAGRIWTRREVAFLEQNAFDKSIFAMSQELGRTEASVERKLRDQKIRARRDLKPRSEWLTPDRAEETIEELECRNRLHLDDLKRAGHTWWQRTEDLDVAPSYFSPSSHAFYSCTGSPAAMCVE